MSSKVNKCKPLLSGFVLTHARLTSKDPTAVDPTVLAGEGFRTEPALD